MKLENLFWAIALALTFSSWPIIGKRIGISGPWMTTIVYVSGLLCVVAYTGKTLVSNACPLRVAAVMAFIGMLNGLAVMVYSAKCTDTTINTSVFLMTVSIVSLVSAPILNYLINKETVSPRQIIGVVVGIVAIILITKK